ncbi:MAG: sugar kinase [Spirochaetes bacterium]|uniref:Sugar kinase n=1 Tax=Candidatus Ornithospirochaeta stercoripullorum TaxID=2840899 RepID=A0A9D9DZQ8_9SPIO|nr:sugar kinase [Candidatus Ornithospirochaeta stercoripullorum]
MGKVICFGELMLRLNPSGYLRIVQAENFEASYAGGEANVAVSLANYGEDAAFVSVIPDNLIGQSAVNSLRRWGVDTSLIKRSGDRLGIYFVEKGASQRASKVIYDRKYSAISLSTASDYDWKSIFKDADWFHFTGITPALSDSLASVCLEACKAAKEAGVTISCDLNYRKNLWSKEKAGEVMGALVPYVDVLIANEEDASDVFGITAENTDVESGSISTAGYEKVAAELSMRFGCKAVAITLRGSISANDNNWAGMLYSNGRSYLSKNYLIHIVDRVGGGDSFGGALIHALHSGYSEQEAIEFAVAASCLKQTIEQDFNHVSESEVKALMNGNGTGRVQR